MNNALIECLQLSQYFDDAGQRVEIFSELDFTIKNGESVAITGASGSGKSTLLYLLGGLEKPKSGQVLIDGTELSQLSANKLAAFRNHPTNITRYFYLTPRPR